MLCEHGSLSRTRAEGQDACWWKHSGGIGRVTESCQSLLADTRVSNHVSIVRHHLGDHITSSLLLKLISERVFLMKILIHDVDALVLLPLVVLEVHIAAQDRK